MKEKKLVKGVYLDQDVVKEIEVMAKLEQRTVSNMLTVIVNSFIKEKSNDSKKKNQR